MRLPNSRVVRLLATAVVGFVCVVVLIASTDWLDQLGAAPTGERLSRIQRSANYRDGSFQNPGSTSVLNPGVNGVFRMMRDWLGGHEQRVPPGPMPIGRLTSADFATPPASGLRATWLGHSTVLVEIDGGRILFDPVWARRASPSSLVGPARFHAAPLALNDLPPLDAIVASHDHYDHVDRDVVKAIVASPTQARARFIVPLEVGAHLERWGVAPGRITELDWSAIEPSSAPDVDPWW